MDCDDYNRVLLDVQLGRASENYTPEMAAYRKEAEAWYARLKEYDPKASIDVREP